MKKQRQNRLLLLLKNQTEGISSDVLSFSVQKDISSNRENDCPASVKLRIYKKRLLANTLEVL